MVKRLILNKELPLVYLITDRKNLPRKSEESEMDVLARFIDRAFDAGVDMIQIRERDLSARELFLLARKTSQSAHLLINDRADVAASVGAGVHLTTRSMPAGALREAFDPMLIGVSTHSMKEALEAERAGADFIVFGPVFETESKRIYGPPVGLDALEAVAGRLRIPVLAIGGIKLNNFKDALDSGAAGVAAISLFAESDDLRSVVRTIKSK